MSKAQIISIIAALGLGLGAGELNLIGGSIAEANAAVEFVDELSPQKYAISGQQGAAIAQCVKANSEFDGKLADVEKILVRRGSVVVWSKQVISNIEELCAKMPGRCKGAQ